MERGKSSCKDEKVSQGPLLKGPADSLCHFTTGCFGSFCSLSLNVTIVGEGPAPPSSQQSDTLGVRPGPSGVPKTSMESDPERPACRLTLASSRNLYTQLAEGSLEGGDKCLGLWDRLRVLKQLPAESKEVTLCYCLTLDQLELWNGQRSDL